METTTITRKADGIQIYIPHSDSPARHLHIAVGACHLRIIPGEGDSDGGSSGGSEGSTWVTGRYYGPIEALPLEISQIGGEVEIRQKHDWAEIGHLFNGAPTLELVLGKAMPYTLTIETGASESYLGLGGLPLTRVTLRQGAGKVVADFPVANPLQMDRFTISSGASGIALTNLANANFAEMEVEGGAASYNLDFGGVLRRDALVKVTAAMSSTDISVPRSTAAKITSQILMGGLNIENGLTKKDEAVWTDAALAGAQPMLYLQVTLTMGSLNLHCR